MSRETFHPNYADAVKDESNDSNSFDKKKNVHGSKLQEILKYFDRTLVPGLDLNAVYPEYVGKEADVQGIDQEKEKALLDHLNTQYKALTGGHEVLTEMSEVEQQKVGGLIEEVVEQYWKPTISMHTKEALADFIDNLIVQLNQEGVEQVLEKSLDLNEKGNINKVGHWIKLLEELYWRSERIDPESREEYFRDFESEDAVVKKIVGELMEKIKNESEGNYFLNERIKYLVECIKKGEVPEVDTLPFDFDFGHYAKWQENGRLAVTPMGDDGDIEDDIEMYTKLENTFLEEMGATHSDKEKSALQKEMQETLSAVANKIRTSYYFEELKPYQLRSFTDQVGDDKDKSSDQSLYDFEYLHSRQMRKQIEKDFGIVVEYINLPVRNKFFQFIKEKNIKDIEPAKNFSKKYGEAGLVTFLSLAQDPTIGNKLVELGNRLPEDDAYRLFDQYHRLITSASSKAEKIQTLLAQQYPEINLSREELSDCFMVRAKDLLNESFNKMEDGKLDIDQVLAELNQETAIQEVLRVQFMKIAELLSKDDVDLETYNHTQEMVIKSIGESGLVSEAAYLRALNAMGKLKPMPELYWKVDREPEEYNKRLGVNVPEVLKRVGQGGNEKTLLEFGPGSGLAKHKLRLSGAADNFTEFAMSDALYYDLAEPIKHLIDFDKIQAKLGKELNAQDKQSLIEYIKRTIVIKVGQTAVDKIEYDQEFQSDIAHSPNALKEYIKKSGHKVSLADTVPTDQAVETPDGPIYAEKFEVAKQSPAWQEARRLFMGEVEKYLRDDFDEQDVYEILNAHPAGIMIGDFNDVTKLKNDQLDFALGVRSTVYVEREQYPEFIKNVIAKLKDGGIYIDDNVRENFGRYYRLAELKQVQEDLVELKRKGGIDFDVTISLVIGRGVAEEDYKKDDAPIAVVIAKGKADLSVVSENLLKSSKLVGLDEVVANGDYLKSLDQSGRVKKSINTLPRAA
ncbi:MAG: hypothetical protein WC808_00230 [Patescibacteria group bacterium]|jgi:hypothetical protein